MDLQIDAVYHMDCLEGLKKLPNNFVDSIVTDPPYELGFMDKKWDKTGIAYNVGLWKECLRVLKPGGYLLAFGGTRTYHRMVCAIEDAGFEIRDCIMWLYGCVDEETEVLTAEGFKRYNEIKEGDMIFSLSLEDNKLVKNKVKHIFRYPVVDETMCLINNHDTEQLITLNHRVLLKEKIETEDKKKGSYKTQYKYLMACSLPDTFKLPLSGIYDGGLTIGDDFAELIGWVIAKGDYRGNAVIITAETQLAEHIRNILKKCGIKYAEHQDNGEDTKYQFCINGETVNMIKSIIPEKKLNWRLIELPYKEKERLIMGLCADNRDAFYHENKEQLEIFQVLLHMTNKQGKIDCEKYLCAIYHKNATEIGCKSQKQPFKYSGIVWCIETEIGNFVARRNDKIFITGNSGFPKSLDISKAIDKQLGAQREKVRYKARNGTFCSPFDTRPWIEKAKEQGYYEVDDKNPVTSEAKQWNGWGTALKPAYEPIVVARKPLSEKNVALNVLKWGTGGLNIDACRIPIDPAIDDPRLGGKGFWKTDKAARNVYNGGYAGEIVGSSPQGRYPANVILDEEAAKTLDEQTGVLKSGKNCVRRKASKFIEHEIGKAGDIQITYGDKGGASRFFYCAKVNRRKREEFNSHPTVKPLELIKYLVKLVTPPEGICLDPFEGSGTHVLACIELGFHYLGFEKEREYYNICMRRVQEFCASKSNEEQQAQN